jgi:hypothetical protein
MHWLSRRHVLTTGVYDVHRLRFKHILCRFFFYNLHTMSERASNHEHTTDGRHCLCMSPGFHRRSRAVRGVRAGKVQDSRWQWRMHRLRRRQVRHDYSRYDCQYLRRLRRRQVLYVGRGVLKCSLPGLRRRHVLDSEGRVRGCRVRQLRRRKILGNPRGLYFGQLSSVSH